MEKPLISLYSSALRPQNWLQIFESVADSSVPFEIVFVGPNAPDYTLPDNFKYIKSNVKPAQCYEIAARYATGELLLSVSDDIEFPIFDSLGELYRNYMRYNDEKFMLSCRFMVDKKDASYECHHYPTSDSTSFIMPVGCLLSKKLYIELGGVDKKFISVYWDLDIAMRLYAIGGRVLLSDNVYLNEVRQLHLSVKTFTPLYGSYDIQLLNDLWMIDGKMQLNRSQPFEPFVDENILTESQGIKGIWD